MTGNGYNRWFDKSLTMIFASNGEMGLNIEHTSAEATVNKLFHEYLSYRYVIELTIPILVSF